MWDRVLAAIAAVCAADDVLISVYGGSMRLAGTGDHRVPLLEFQLIGDGETELWAPCTIQFDQFTKDDTAIDGMAQLIASEQRLRALYHTDLPVDINGVGMFCEYAGGDVLASPSRDGYYGRAIRFRLTPLRRQYAASTP